MEAITTTLNAIRDHSPCEDGWEILLKHLGKTKADNEALRFSTILESNGLNDALWCLRSLPEQYHPKIRYLAADYAERVLHIYEAKHPNDDRPRKAIQAARDFADGKITEEERAAARDAAWAAARDATGAARAAAEAAWAAAEATWAAAEATVGTAAWYARYAGYAGYPAERELQVELLIKYFG